MQAKPKLSVNRFPAYCDPPFWYRDIPSVIHCAAHTQLVLNVILDWGAEATSRPSDRLAEFDGTNSANEIAIRARESYHQDREQHADLRFRSP